MFSQPCKMSRLRPKGPLGYTIKGKVTKINTHFLYFEVDETFRIYINLENATLCLPVLHDEVELTNPKKFNNSTFTAVMGKDTVFKFPQSSQESGDTKTYVEFLRQNNFHINAEEIIAIDLIIRKLQTFLNNEVIQLCIDALYQHAIYCYDCKKSLKLIQGNVPKDLQFANCNSELYTFLSFTGLCSFNVYPSKKIERVTDVMCEYLFGILAISEPHGYFTLQDNTSEILVKFATSSESLYKFHNCLVLIKQYTIFTEIYEIKTQLTLQYILLRVEDVAIILSDIRKEEQKLFYRVNEPMNANYNYSFFLQLIKISEIIYGYNDGPECWVEGLIACDKNFQKFEVMYFVLPKELLKIVSCLKEKVIYKIFTNQKLKYGNLTKELYSLKQNRKLIILTSDSIFQETELRAVEDATLILDNFQEIKSHIAKTDDYKVFSFILTIDKKEFQRISFASWFPKRHKNIRYFGEMENHQQRLIFRDVPTNSFIDLYLTNRENHVVPLGLISHMKVKVKHVQVNKNKYLKTTVFTGFEIIDYCPDIKFCSANLSFRDRNAWYWRKKTSPILLGLYAHIPTNCIIHGSVLFRALLDLRFNIVCAKCKQVLNLNSCGRCNTKDKDVAVFMIIQVQDSINPTFYMEIDNIYFLLELVGLRNDKGIDAFFAECLNWPGLDINFLKISECYQIHDADLYPVLQEIVDLIRTHINFKFYFIMDVVCIKQCAEGRKPLKILEFEFVS